MKNCEIGGFPAGLFEKTKPIRQEGIDGQVYYRSVFGIQRQDQEKAS